jgi:hypothetical protein
VKLSQFAGGAVYSSDRKLSAGINKTLPVSRIFTAVLERPLFVLTRVLIGCHSYGNW